MVRMIIIESGKMHNEEAIQWLETIEHEDVSEATKEQREVIRQIIKYLFGELSLGWTSLQISKKISDEIDAKRLEDWGFWWPGIAKICTHESILCLAKLVLPNEDSITIHYLMNKLMDFTRQNNRVLYLTNHVERNAPNNDAYYRKKKEELEKSIKMHEAVLSGPFIRPLAKVRKEEKRIRDYREQR